MQLELSRALYVIKSWGHHTVVTNIPHILKINMQNTEKAKKKKNQAKLTGKFFEAHIPHQFKYQVLNMTEF